MLFQHFDWDLTHYRYFFFIIFWPAITSYELERPALKKRILWWKLRLDNPFPVPSLCKLNHISVCFIQISTKITCKQLIPFRESHVFFEVIPGVLGRSVNFNITQISIKTAHVSRLSVSCDYGSTDLNDSLNAMKLTKRFENTLFWRRLLSFYL